MLISVLIMLFCLPALADEFPAVNTSALSEYDKNAPIGFGASATGSEDKNPVTVTTLDELIAALTGTEKKTVYVSGTITFTGRVKINDAANKTIYGLPGSMLQNPTHSGTPNESGILTLSECSNIIMRNLTFKGAGAYDIDGYDNLTLSGCSNIWIDHCDFQDGVDGNFDCNNASDNICVSWCRFRYLITPWSDGSGGSNDHRFSNLWGGGDTATDDEGHLNTTFYACWWDNGCKQRMPRIRYGKVHILNCLYSSSSADYCIGAGYRSNIYVEKSKFAISNNAWQNFATSGSYTDYNILLVGNEGAGDDIQSSGGIAQFVPSYNYTAMNASAVSSVVSNYAGATLTYGQAAQESTLYKWEANTETGGTIASYSGGGTTATTDDITSSYIRLSGKSDFSTEVVTITFDNPLHAGDKIYITAYRNKDQTGKTSGFKAKFEKGSSTVASSTGMEFVNIHSAVSGTDEYGTEANTSIFIVPDDAEGSTTMTMTRSHTATNLFITKLEITTTGDESEEEEISGIYQWKVTDTPAGGIVTHDRSDLLQIAFGIAVKDNANDWNNANGAVTVTYKDIAYSFDKYATTSNVNGSNSSSLAANGSTNNNYIAFVPKYSGTLILVGHNLGTNNTNKPTWCYENGIVKSGTIIGDGSLSIAYDGQSDVRKLNGGTAVTGGIKISVTANKLYTFSIQGSKARWCGVIYEYSNTTDTYTVTYENNDADAYGTVPVAVEVNQYVSTAIPTNRTLYKTGYTLTGWSDGTNTYAIGANYTPTASVTMHPVFTTNSANLGDLATDKTVTWNFGKGNGAPDYDGSINANVQQVNIGSSVIDLGIKMPGGSNEGRNDEWLNNQQKDMMVPVVKGAVVKAKVYYANTNATINGETITYNESTHGTVGNVVFTYTYTGNDPTEIAVNVGNQFLSYISVTYPGSGEDYTNTWQFGKSNGAPEFALQKSAEYTYIVNDHSLMVNTDAGKLNNASRTDQWCQCNNGTLFKVPVFAGAKLTWGRYNSGSEAGFTIDGQLFNDYYIATENGTVEMTASGINYLSYIKIEPTTLYEITGTISGGDINGSTIILTAADNGEKYSATVASNTFTMKVPADTYTPELGGDVAYIISSPESVTVTAAGSIGTITIAAAQPQAVTGDITNVPATAFTLTFTATNDASHTTAVNCAANATSFSTTLNPDTYTISSSVGTLSPLSVESFTVVKDAVTHNIYYPEAAVPAATQQNITVDNTLNVASANNYKTVTDALAAAKAGGISAPVITLTSGQTYREQVIVDIADVTFKTSGTEKATITFYYGIGYCYYSLNSKGVYDKDRAMTRNSIIKRDPERWGATVKVTRNGKNFKAENIIFENSFNQYYTQEEIIDGVQPNGVQSITYDRTLTANESGYKAADSKAVTERAAAIAFEGDPKGCQLYNCEFRGSQDTFYTGSSNTLYVKDCNIIGNTDYIFGGGYVVFDNCDLTIGGYSDQDVSAYITAYKDGDNLEAGKCYVFRDCTVKGSNRTHVKANLGRDWGGAAASVYYFNLKNEIGNKMSFTWTNMGGGINAGTANLHIYDFDPTVNANYNTTGSNGANINGVLTEAEALPLYADVVSTLGFTPERIYKDALELSEASYYNICRIAAAANAGNNVTRTVQLTRAIGADKWNTIVLPFDMTADQVTSTFGEGTKLAQLTSGSTADNLKFTTATEITANQPYAIKVPTAITVAEPVNISGVTIKGDEPTQEAGGWNFVGTYTQGNIPQDSYFFSNNMLYQAADATNTIKAFRAWFTYNGANASRNLSFTIDDETTSISEELRVKGEESDGVIYDLQGRRVRSAEANSSLFTIHSSLKPGVYIVNGKKIVIK